MSGNDYPSNCPHGYLVSEVRDVGGWTHHIAPAECPTCPAGKVLATFKTGGEGAPVPEPPASDCSPCTKTEGCILLGPHEDPTPCLVVVDEDGKILPPPRPSLEDRLKAAGSCTGPDHDVPSMFCGRPTPCDLHPGREP